jgi:hypothetical protein
MAEVKEGERCSGCGAVAVKIERGGQSAVFVNCTPECPSWSEGQAKFLVSEPITPNMEAATYVD